MGQIWWSALEIPALRRLRRKNGSFEGDPRFTVSCSLKTGKNLEVHLIVCPQNLCSLQWFLHLSWNCFLNSGDLAGDLSRMDLSCFAVLSQGPDDVPLESLTECLQGIKTSAEKISESDSEGLGQSSEIFQFLIFSKLSLILDKLLAFFLKQ